MNVSECPAMRVSAAASIASNGASEQPPPVAYHPVAQIPPAKILAGLRIAIARSHIFHYTKTKTSLEPIAHGQPQRHSSTGEAVYRQRRLTASYPHLYFPSNPAVAASLFLP